MQTHTKIICTIGPSVSSLESIIQLMEAGMNVARLNFSHGSYSEHLELIGKLKEARAKLNRPLAIMLDTKGPEIRLGKMKEGEARLTAGQSWWLTQDPLLGDEKQASLSPPEIVKQLKVGMELLFDDGYITSVIREVIPGSIRVEIMNSGLIKSGKGVNIPHQKLEFPLLNDRDRESIAFGCAQDIDLIATSFVCTPEHIKIIKKLVQEAGKPNILVIAKIENQEGIENFDEILEVSDGIMIARGDLGVQLPLYQVPKLQKMMIRKCHLAGKPSITATQMLESMIHNPRPTRAEASDVANAIYDATSAVMLSGETAAGRYPYRTVQTMKQIIHETEKDIDYLEFLSYHDHCTYQDILFGVTLAAVKTAYSLKCQAIFVCTASGTTARLISRLRPNMPILAITDQEKCYHQLALNWGVIPIYSPACHTLADAFDTLSAEALKSGLLKSGELVVVIGAISFGKITTHTMFVERVTTITPE